MAEVEHAFHFKVDLVGVLIYFALVMDPNIILQQCLICINKLIIFQVVHIIFIIVPLFYV